MDRDIHFSNELYSFKRKEIKIDRDRMIIQKPEYIRNVELRNGQVLDIRQISPGSEYMRDSISGGQDGGGG
ncbi:MAG: hypothetical protein CME62_07795 [Halobacteriovoraceae bacterium]|nr:hypothetical protein [Halobacteriovoraceae bacterium]